MWRSYFQVFFRNLVQQKTIAVINILGLALGLCAFLMIGVYVSDQYSYEARWQQAERIVRLVNDLKFPGGEVTIAFTSELAAPRLQDFFPDEIATAARHKAVAADVRVEGEEFRALLWLADRELLDIFDFEVVAGSLEQALAVPNRVALSEESAGRLFGGQAALGRVLTWQLPEGEARTYEVAAVYRPPPGKGVLEFDNLSLWDAGLAPVDAGEDWFGGDTHSYFLLREGVDPATLAPRLDDFVNQQVHLAEAPAGSTISDQFKYRFLHIRDIYFNPNTDEEGGSQASVNRSWC